MKKIEVGIVTKPQGLKGEIRVKLNFNDVSLISNANEIYLNNVPHKIKKITNRNTFVVLSLENVTNIESAEALRNVKLYVNENVLQLEDDEFYVKDVVGFKVVNLNKTEIGTLKDILNYGSADIYVLNLTESQKELMFVNAQNIVTDIDHANKTIVINDSLLEQLSV